MKILENKSNTEIALEIKQIQLDFDAIKQDIIKLYDLLERKENEFNEANAELHKRLTGKQL